MAIKSPHKIALNSNTKLILLVLGLPILGLIYCGLGIAAMMSWTFIREHALISGAIYILIPFTIAASIWLQASAKAYRH